MSRAHIGYRRVIVSRILYTALSIAVQILWFVFSILKLSAYSAMIDALLRLLSLVIVIYILCKDINPSYKMIWIMLIMLLPIFGGLLYLFAGNKRPSKKMNRKIAAAKNDYQKMLSDIEDIPIAEDRRAESVFRYVKELSGYPYYKNTDVKYYPVGEEMYADMLSELSKAEHFIFLEYFIISEGKMWNTILKILKEKADKGVEVRIIYDDMGCVALLPPRYCKKLENLSPNIKCLAFNPVVPVLSLVMNNRDHRKIMVIDGHTGFVGGINLSDEYINQKERFGHWKDTGVLVRGEGVLNITEMFLELWHAFRNTDIRPEKTKYLPSLYGASYISEGYVQPFYDTPLDTEALGENVYIEILSRAEKYVYIFTPYLILDDIMKTALCLAAKRGVDVRIVTPGIPDKKMVYRMTRANYAPLLEAGVRIFEYTPGFIHAKSFVSDDVFGVVGTINLDYRSLFLHFECGVMMYGCSAVADLRDDCVSTMAKSREITAENLKSYYRGTMFDALLRFFAPML